MDNPLHNVSIKIKLSFIILLPILGILYFSSVDIHNKYMLRVEAQNTEKLNIFNHKIAILVDNLQKERGLGGSYLTSKGKIVVLERTNQIIQTNKAFQSVIDYLRFMKGEPFDRLLIDLNSFESELLLIRNNTIDFTINSSELILFYSKNIDIFLDFIYKSESMTNNKVLSEILLSYSNFLYAKEKTAIERVMVTNFLINKSVTIDEKFKFMNLLLLRKTNVNYFIKFLKNDEILKSYTQLMKNNSSLRIKRIEKKIFSDKFSVDMKPEVWFKFISIQIASQHSISEKIYNDLLNKSLEFKDLMFKESLNLLYYTLTILTLLIILVVYIFRSINTGLDSIMSGVSFISKNNISKYKNIDIKSNDELGGIAIKFNEMVEALKEREVINRRMTIDLKKAKKKLEKKDRIKSQFLANMSHEIRTPLNAIIGFMQILKNDEKDEKRLRYFDIMTKSSDNLLEIVNAILNFTKIENNQIILENKDFKLIDEIDSIVNITQVQMKEKDLYFELNIDDNLPQDIFIDGTKLKQVLTNLLSNAIKFSEKSKRIIFSIQYINNKITFSIKDEGIGIEKEKFKEVFKPFVQVDSSVTRKYGGTGLGLAISKKFVEALGGKLQVNSSLGMGSEFFFTLPIQTSKKPNLEIEANDKNPFQIAGKVLVVEDNKANQMFIKVLLKKEKLTFEIANDGFEAIEFFKNNKYDIILMDENMPKMSGIEATKKILKLEKEQNIKHTPIIALTANALVGDRQRFLDAGMDEYLTKPLTKKDLLNVLEKFL